MKKYKIRIVLSIFVASLLIIALLSYNLITSKSLHFLILIAVIVINVSAMLVGAFSYKKLKLKIALLEDDDILYSELIEKLPLEVDEIKIKEKIEGRTCLITGGGGTIGSELSTQVAKFNPKRLIIIDIYENNAYHIQQKLLREFAELNLDIEISSIRDFDKMDRLFKKYNPDIIFHAAAHKHVPMMENSPDEAIKNNIGGTLHIAKLAEKYKAEEFVLISTDKAVNPTSVMGATKYCSEMIVGAFASRANRTKFLTVRFGNVIGSSGSVIPLFKEQILNGGPLTLTHPDVERYFMSISEAVQLVLQSTIYDEGTFILDMGKPVRIADLANDMMVLFGYKPNSGHKPNFGHNPNEAIKIEYIGLRAGEKLHEEFIGQDEELTAVGHNRIYKVAGNANQHNKNQYDELMLEIAKLIQSAEEGAPSSELKEKLYRIIEK